LTTVVPPHSSGLPSSTILGGRGLQNLSCMDRLLLFCRWRTILLFDGRRVLGGRSFLVFFYSEPRAGPVEASTGYLCDYPECLSHGKRKKEKKHFFSGPRLAFTVFVRDVNMPGPLRKSEARPDTPPKLRSSIFLFSPGAGGRMPWDGQTRRGFATAIVLPTSFSPNRLNFINSGARRLVRDVDANTI
jgi:hypothetical protein